MDNPVTTTKLKYDGRAKRPWQGHLVDATEDGWLVVFYEEPGYSTRQGVDVQNALQHFHTKQPLTVLACFDGDGHVIEYQCDAALPATLNGRDIQYIDLDLDLMVSPSFFATLRDEDQFAERTVSLSYPPEVVRQAWAGIELARELVAKRSYPLDGAAERRLVDARMWLDWGDRSGLMSSRR